MSARRTAAMVVRSAAYKQGIAMYRMKIRICNPADRQETHTFSLKVEFVSDTVLHIVSKLLDTVEEIPLSDDEPMRRLTDWAHHKWTGKTGWKLKDIAVWEE